MANLFLDIASGAIVGSSIAPAALTATTTGSAVDLSQSNANMACAALDIGEVVGDTPTIDVKIQESNSSSSGFVDIPGAAFAQVTTSGVAGSSGAAIKSFQRQKRYLRAVATLTGLTSAVVGVSVFAQAAVEPITGSGGFSESPSDQPGAPTLTSATISANGTTFTLIFSEPVIWTGRAASVTSALGGGSLTLSSGERTTTLVFSIPKVYISELAALTMLGGAAVAVSSGNPSALVAGQLVTNNSTQDGTAPTLTSATVAANGTTFTLIFSEAVQTFAGGANGFAITASGGAATVGYASGTGTTTIVFTVNRTISTGETITTAYVPGTIQDAAGNLLVAYSGTTVTNNSAQP